MPLRLIVAVTLAIAAAHDAGAQPQGAPALDRVLQGLREAIQGLPPALRSQPLVDAARWLDNRKQSTPPANVGDEYVRSLDRAATLLRRYPTPAVVDDVTRELEAKVEHCRALGLGMGGSVLLKVNTVRGPTAVPNWQVLYLLKFDEWLQTPPRVFPRVSSPTDSPLDPGRYWIWARDPTTGRVSDRVLVQVAGEREVILDLPVP